MKLSNIGERQMKLILNQVDKTDFFVQLNKRFVVLVLGIVDRIFFNQQLLWDSKNIVP